jgi:hypothetical protein
MPAHGPGDAGGGEHLVKTIDAEHGVSVPLWRRGRSGDGREVGEMGCDVKISNVVGFSDGAACVRSSRRAWRAAIFVWSSRRAEQQTYKTSLRKKDAATRFPQIESPRTPRETHKRGELVRSHVWAFTERATAASLTKGKDESGRGIVLT